MIRLIALLLLLLAMLWLAVSLYRRVVGLLASRQSKPGEGAEGGAKKEGGAYKDSWGGVSEELVSCARCGVFIPLREAVRFYECYYCSKSCLPDRAEGR